MFNLSLTIAVAFTGCMAFTSTGRVAPTDVSRWADADSIVFESILRRLAVDPTTRAFQPASIVVDVRHADIPSEVWSGGTNASPQTVPSIEYPDSSAAIVRMRIVRRMGLAVGTKPASLRCAGSFVPPPKAKELYSDCPQEGSLSYVTVGLASVEPSCDTQSATLTMCWSADVMRTILTAGGRTVLLERYVVTQAAGRTTIKRVDRVIIE